MEFQTKSFMSINIKLLNAKRLDTFADFLKVYGLDVLIVDNWENAISWDVKCQIAVSH